MSLPNELLAEIAGYIPARHATTRYVVNVKSLAALASTCRTMRDVATPYLFKDVVIDSEKKLNALASVPKELLSLIQ